MSTAGPDVVADLAPQVAAAGGTLVDAPTLGAPTVVRAGEAAVLVGGAEADLFEPYNQHFLQDVGAFLVGLGVVLLQAGLSSRADGLTVALIGAGVAATLHTVSHFVGRDLGGVPNRDIPTFALIAAILLAAGGWRWRHARAATGANRA